VFDVAKTVLMLETGMSDDSRERFVNLPLASPETKIAFLTKQGVDVLVCGAVSRQLREMAEADGIQVYPFVAGEIGDVIGAWRQGRLDQVSYSMPGCRRYREKFRQRGVQKDKQ